MHIKQYQLDFLTPAFLGNARQSAQWRTPPFKAQLRQWWRVVMAQSVHFNVQGLLRREKQLFGTAGDGQDTRRSLVRIRLDNWNEGSMNSWPAMEKVRHPDVKQPVGSDLYLGFGPLEYNRSSRNTALKNAPAINAGEKASLGLACPQAYAGDLSAAIRLMNLYGTMGGRSRNGWGSLEISGINVNDQVSVTDVYPDQAYQRDWQDALELDWPHAIGTDSSGPLVWQTGLHETWETLMQELARLKIGLRTSFVFNSGKNAPRPEERHWLSYPVSNHSVKAWGNNSRLPNSLRFKARRAPGESGKLVGVIFHMPCLPPGEFKPDRAVISSVWKRVHQYLDSQEQQLKRISA